MAAFDDDWKTLKDSKTVEPLAREKRGYLGVTVSAESGGARVTRVIPNTPAEKSGLRVGDLITHVQGRELFEGAGLPEIIGAIEAGKEVEFRVERGDKFLELKAKLDSRLKSPPPPPEEKKEPGEKEKKDDK
jgi:S1-C subfamily serine protease